MARHFGPQNMRNGYAAMGGSMKRPHHPSVRTRSVQEAIARERRVAANMAKAKKSK